METDGFIAELEGGRIVAREVGGKETIKTSNNDTARERRRERERGSRGRMDGRVMSN